MENRVLRSIRRFALTRETALRFYEETGREVVSIMEKGFSKGSGGLVRLIPCSWGNLLKNIDENKQLL